MSAIPAPARAAIALPPAVATGVATALTTAAAALATRGGGAWAFVLLATCAALPWLLAPPEAMARCLTPGRRGWWIAGASAVAAWVIPSAAVAVLVSVVLGGMVMTPAAGPAGVALLRAAPAIVAFAFAEELLFRGCLQQAVLDRPWGRRRCGPVTVKNALAALAFAAAHLPVAGLPAAAAALASGLVLGWLVERSDGSILPAVALHTAGNLAATWSGLLLVLNLPLAGAVSLTDLARLLLGG